MLVCVYVSTCSNHMIYSYQTHFINHLLVPSIFTWDELFPRILVSCFESVFGLLLKIGHDKRLKGTLTVMYGIWMALKRNKRKRELLCCNYGKHNSSQALQGYSCNFLLCPNYMWVPLLLNSFGILIENFMHHLLYPSWIINVCSSTLVSWDMMQYVNIGREFSYPFYASSFSVWYLALCNSSHQNFMWNINSLFPF